MGVGIYTGSAGSQARLGGCTVECRHQTGTVATLIYTVILTDFTVNLIQEGVELHESPWENAVGAPTQTNYCIARSSAQSLSFPLFTWMSHPHTK